MVERGGGTPTTDDLTSVDKPLARQVLTTHGTGEDVLRETVRANQNLRPIFIDDKAPTYEDLVQRSKLGGGLTYFTCCAGEECKLPKEQSSIGAQNYCPGCEKFAHNECFEKERDSEDYYCLHCSKGFK